VDLNPLKVPDEGPFDFWVPIKEVTLADLKRMDAVLHPCLHTARDVEWLDRLIYLVVEYGDLRMWDRDRGLQSKALEAVREHARKG
jgi:hypothetical protein